MICPLCRAPRHKTTTYNKQDVALYTCACCNALLRKERDKNQLKALLLDSKDTLFIIPFNLPIPGRFEEDNKDTCQIKRRRA